MENRIIIIDSQEYGTADIIWKKCKKKPIIIDYIKMDKDFEVETLEGTMKGKAGDYLLKGVENECYPCRKDIFEKTYDIIGEK